MKKYQTLLLSLSLLTFVACGSSGGGSNLNPTIPSNVDTAAIKELTQNKESVTIENSHLDKTLNPEKSGKTTFNGNININDETSIGAIAKEGVHLTNGEKSTITGTMETGMKTLEKASITNNGEISGHIKNGMSANGDDSIATNNHLITLNSNNDTQEADDEGSVDSKKKNITIIGMKALKGASIINGIDGKISGDLTFGMFTSNKKSKAINYGKISSNGTDNKGIDTYNDGQGDYTEKLAIGMEAENGASIINSKEGSIFGRLTFGMYAENKESNAINFGHINSIGSTLDEIFREDNTSYEYEVSGIGMEAENGASITNAKGGSISGRLADGMYAYGKESNAINEGDITSDGYYYIYKDSPIYQKLKLNSQDITKKMLNHLGTGMKAENGASITNGKTGIIQGNFSEGMFLGEDGINTGINNGKIISYGQSSKEHPTFIGMIGCKNSIITNNGVITIKDKTKKDTSYEGIYSNGTVLNTGNISGDFDTGIYIYGNNSKAINQGIIKLNSGYEGMDSYDNSIAINENKIIGSFGNGMKAEDNAISINKGVIDSSSLYGSCGMYGKSNSTLINKKSGTIQGRINIGIYSCDKNSKSYNYGTIIINKNNGIGMKADNGGIAINEVGGKIYLNNSHEIGMYAEGVNSLTKEPSIIKNYGDIYLSGQMNIQSKKISEVRAPIIQDDNSSNLDSNSLTSNSRYNGIDSKGNIGMRIENGAKMINKGTIHFAQSK